MENNTTIGNGMTFCSWATLLLIALKFTGYIDWSWWMVFSPMLAEFALVVFITIVYCLWDRFGY